MTSVQEVTATNNNKVNFYQDQLIPILLTVYSGYDNVMKF